MNTLSLYSDAGIALIRLNRPATRNAIDDTLIAELTHTVATLNQDPELRVVILSGEGEAFCAGMDLGYLARLARFGEEENRADSRALLELLLAIRESPLPWTIDCLACSFLRAAFSRDEPLKGVCIVFSRFGGP